MAIGNTTQLAETIRETYAPGFESAVVRNNEFLGLTLGGRPVFPESPMSSNVERWTLNTAGVTAAVFTEGAAAATPAAQSYAELTASPVYFWLWTRISGHMRDVVRVGGARPGQDPIENEMLAGFEDIKDLLNTTFLGSTYGLAHIIDDGNTVHGIDQSANAYQAATVTNANGALTRADFLNTHESCREDGSRPQIIIAPHNQVTNYLALTGEPNAQNSSLRADVSFIGGGSLDLLPSARLAQVEGLPMVGVQDATDTDIYGLDLRPTSFGPNWEMKVMRPFDVRGPQMVGDDDVMELSCAKVLVSRLVRHNYKIEDVTA